MTRKFLLAALVILLAALCTVHLTTERTPPENVVSPAVHLGMVVPREALEKLKAAETAALAAPQTAEPTADVTAEPAEEESLPATDTSVLAAAITTDALYIRRSGDWDAEALALVDYGTTVAVTGKSGGWYQVRYDGIEGYLSGEYLDLRTSGLTGYGQVTADALNLRSGAGTGYETVTSLPNGAWVSVSGFENGWFYVDYDGVSGYVSGDYLELSASRPQPGGDTSSDSGSSGGSGDLPSGGDAGTVSGSASDLVALALSYQGVPYAYGGASPSGFDCSGYTMYIYQRFGVYLPHGATDQLSYGMAVGFGELQPGDLVFFQDADFSSSAASHCGIYIGDGQFIHATSDSRFNCVKITSFSESYYASHFLTGRRLF